MSHLAASVEAVTLVPMTAAIAAPVPAVRPAPLDRLPGTSDEVKSADVVCNDCRVISVVVRR